MLRENVERNNTFGFYLRKEKKAKNVSIKGILYHFIWHYNLLHEVFDLLQSISSSLREGLRRENWNYLVCCSERQADGRLAGPLVKNKTNCHINTDLIQFHFTSCRHCEMMHTAQLQGDVNQNKNVFCQQFACYIKRRVDYTQTITGTESLTYLIVQQKQ